MIGARIEQESRTRARIIRRALAARILFALGVLACRPSWCLSPADVPPPADGEELALNSELRIRVRSGREIELSVRPAPGEGYLEVARRVAGSAAKGADIEKLNGVARPTPKEFLRVPLAFLSSDYRALVLLNLFPNDRREGQDWVHIARSGTLPTYGEGLWQVAEWFTGDGNRFDELRSVNALASPELAVGTRIRIPAAVLHPAFRAMPASQDEALFFGEDELGSYAGYRLKAGEALYSAVVVRFTGRTAPEDVESIAEDLARRSGIRDLRDIPIGFLVKLPVDLLEPEHLPSGHPERRELEAERAEVAAEMARTPAPAPRTGLKDVLVILDPGHGGRDLGTMNHGIWEHDYVYDVACRLKERLQRETSAHVELTLEDASTGCNPSSGDRLKANREGTLNTLPPFLPKEEGEAGIAVNLRWYLANSRYRSALRGGTSADRILFLSLHADARHPSLRGVMVYVPGARFRTGTYGFENSIYRRFKEVREEPLVSFSRRDRVRSEAISRRLASRIIESFRSQGLAVQPYEPVRDKVIRGRKTWLPAVLRGNIVPAKVLIEMVNMSNTQDASVLASAADRERMARALETSIREYFGERPRDDRQASKLGG